MPVVPLCPLAGGVLAFFMLRDHFPFGSGNDFGPWKSMDARDLADGHSRFFYVHGHIRKLAASLHVPGARAGEKDIPLLDLCCCPNADQGFEDKTF